MNARSRLHKRLFVPKFKLVLFCTLGVAAISLLFISFRILIENFTRQVSSSYGISDEGFLLAMLKMRSQGNVENHIWPFTEILRIPFEISGGNVFLYRLTGILVIVGLFSYLLLVIKKANFDKFIFVVITTVTASLFLTFPTPFNFLLITPGYQWILILSSTVITLLMMFRKNLQDFNHIEIILVNVLVISSILARPTGGIVILALIGIYAVPHMKSFSLRILLPQSVIWATVVLLNIFNLRERFIALYLASQEFDPNGYNLLNEIPDIGLPFLFCTATVTLGFLISLKLGSATPLEKYECYLIGISTVAIFLLISLKLSTSKLVLVLVIYAFSLGCLSFVVFRRIETVLKLFLISFCPFFAQFGSNISSLVNPLYLYLSLSVFFVSLLIKLEKAHHYANFKLNVQLGVVFILFLNSLIYLNYAKQNNNVSYEKSVGETATTRSNTDGLMYNEFRLQNLDSFKSQAKIGGKKVTDLSFWHPGLIVFAGGYPNGWSLPDEYFIESIDRQLRFLIERNDPRMFSKDSLILLESGKPEQPNSICLPITSYVLNSSLGEAILDRNLNVLVQVVAVYESSPEDFTLYPNHAVLVKVC